MAGKGLPTLSQVIVDGYLLALADSDVSAASDHWDIFGDSFADVIALDENLQLFRRNGLSEGLDDSFPPRSGGQIYSKGRQIDLKGTVLDAQIPLHPGPQGTHLIGNGYRILSALVGLDFVVKLNEGDIGDPRHVIVKVGERVFKGTVSELEHTYFAWQLSNFFEPQHPAPLIVEIGAGFGGLAMRLKRLFPRAKIALLDLPEVNAIQHYYLQKTNPGANVIGYREYKRRQGTLFGEDVWDFAVLPWWAGKDLGDAAVDLFINTRSFMEMRSLVVAEYFRLIQRTLKVGGFFYNVNRYAKDTSGELFTMKACGYDEQWAFLISQPLWNPLCIRKPPAHELLARRLDCANNIDPPAEHLARLARFDGWAKRGTKIYPLV